MSMFEAIPVTHESVRCWWVEPKFLVKSEDLESGRRWSMVTGGLLGRHHRRQLRRGLSISQEAELLGRNIVL